MDILMHFCREGVLIKELALITENIKFVVETKAFF